MTTKTIYKGRTCPTCGNNERYVIGKHCVTCKARFNAEAYQRRLILKRHNVE